MAGSNFPDQRQFARMTRAILEPEFGHLKIVILLSAFISLTALAVPISVQMLIDTVANTALIQPVVVLSLTLFGLLLLSGVFYACREWMLELFERRFFARMSYEIMLKIKNVPHEFLEEAPRAGLINRYFDIMTIKKIFPSLTIGLFTLFFQAAIGLTVTSFYHEALLLFNLVLILMIFVIWQTWKWRAQETSFEMSEAKYDVADWIQGLFFNQERRTFPDEDTVFNQTTKMIELYIATMRSHFRYTMTQLILLLILYAIASAALLGIGGYLVTIGELTLGQLVAAELIMSVIFANFATLGGYWKDLYAVGASIEELYRLAEVPMTDHEEDCDPANVHLTVPWPTAQQTLAPTEIDSTEDTNTGNSSGTETTESPNQGQTPDNGKED